MIGRAVSAVNHDGDHRATLMDLSMALVAFTQGEATCRNPEVLDRSVLDLTRPLAISIG